MTDTSLAVQLLHLFHPSFIYFSPSSSSSACLSGHGHQPVAVPILIASVPENSGICILFRFRPCHAPASFLSSTSVRSALVSSASSFRSLLSDPRLVASSKDRKVEKMQKHKCSILDISVYSRDYNLDKSVLLQLPIICMTLCTGCHSLNMFLQLLSVVDLRGIVSSILKPNCHSFSLDTWGSAHTGIAMLTKMIRASSEFHYLAVPGGKFLRKGVSVKDHAFLGSRPYGAR